MATTEGGAPPPMDPPPAGEADVVITTVVSGDAAAAPDPGSGAPKGAADDPLPAGHQPEEVAWAWAEVDDGITPARASRRVEPEHLTSLEQRLAALEGVPATVEALGKAIRHELERCAGVLFGHDKALGALADRLDAVEARPPDPGLAEGPTASGDVLTRILDQLEHLGKRLEFVETRMTPLEPLPTVVQALRRAVRASDDLIAGETGAREQALAALASQLATEAQARDDALRRLVAQDLDRVSGVSSAQAKALADLAERLAAAEGRLTPLLTVPEDIAALSRILRRELDALVSNTQARDQMLRRALQNEIDQLRATSEAREALAKDLAERLDALESRTAEAALASDQAFTTARGRLEALEAQVAVVERLSTQLDQLRDSTARELEELRGGGRSHDQVAGELTRRLSALDARLARLDPVPGEVQSLRTTMLQDAERTVTALRAADDRISQLSWVPGEFQEARKRIIALTTGLQASQDRVRELEGSLASTNERLAALGGRLPPTPSPSRPPSPPPGNLDMLGGSPPT